MKRLVLASILCLAFAAGLRAQDKPQPQLNPFEKYHLFPAQPESPSVSGIVQGLDLRGRVPSSLNLTFKLNEPKVCSVPLLEAHANAVDPGMAFAPPDKALPMPQAHVPAPACEKK